MVLIPRGPGIAFIESQMVDTCTVTRDVRGVFDDVLNEATGQLERPDGDTDTTIYTGKCLVATINQGDKELPVARMPKEMNYYKVLVPQNTSTGAARIGDYVNVTASAYDASLVGASMRIVKIEVATHTVYRKYTVEQVSDSLGTNNPAV